MPKNKTLPKDFEALLKDGDIARLKKVFDKSSIDAVGGVFKQTALAFHNCPDELARWLVEQGANLSAPDSYGSTPLQSRSGHWQGRIESLIALGAKVNERSAKGTALHCAAGALHVANVQVLLAHGAEVDALDNHGMTPLECALQHVTNATLEEAAQVCALLLQSGAKKTPRMAEFVTRAGTNFEFHRANFNPETRQAASEALNHLYELFEVSPIEERKMHDGVSTIVAKASTWQKQHQELWELLIPGSGAAQTVQGEVIRISGKIARELDGNGGINWDARFKQMADAWLDHVRSGRSLPPDVLLEATELIDDIRGKGGDIERLCELSTIWVKLNPEPVTLLKPVYER